MELEGTTITELPDEILAKIFKTYFTCFDHYVILSNVNAYFRKIIFNYVISKELRFSTLGWVFPSINIDSDIESSSLRNTKLMLMQLPNLTVFHDHYFFTNIAPLLSRYCRNLQIIAIREIGETFH